MCIYVSEFMRCFSSVFVRHSTPSIPYAIPFYIRPSIPLSVSPITCIERSKQGVTFNKELFALIGGVFVFLFLSLKNQLGSEKERQESKAKKFWQKVNEVNEAIEVVNEINKVNEDK
ncbi:hypothetical protein RhiirA4_400952 [Rhizophagus irregularis]|uniref:Uncharacterized protein n=1 Tax=Rhizophagus irregularis TaxID=588596 RepID=A0A2I1GF40_9GLOM|nr:hypothetical protein RhiirA4_400952 [Rhizophagus irregularis]